jgi:hypothetical protein
LASCLKNIVGAVVDNAGVVQGVVVPRTNAADATRCKPHFSRFSLSKRFCISDGAKRFGDEKFSRPRIRRRSEDLPDLLP